jgi:hypothetical protein
MNNRFRRQGTLQAVFNEDCIFSPKILKLAGQGGMLPGNNGAHPFPLINKQINNRLEFFQT